MKTRPTHLFVPRLPMAVKSSCSLCFFSIILLRFTLALFAGGAATTLALFAGGAATAATTAQLIDVNFVTNSLYVTGLGTNITPTMTNAALLGQAGDIWNGIPVSSGTGIHLNYANGSNSPVTMTFTSAGGYNVFSYSGTTPFTNSPYQDLMESYLYTGRLGVFARQTNTLSGLAPNSPYNLVLYSASDTAGAGRVTWFTVNNNTLTNTWNGATSNLISGTDYVEFASALSDGSGNLTITWTGTNDAEGDFNGFQIVPVHEAITWTNPAPITYGTALTTNQLDATANVPGSFVYSNTSGALSTGSVLNAGTNVLTVVFTPNDTVHFTNITASVNLVVAPAPLTITAADASRAYGQNNPIFNGSVIGLTNGDLILLGYNCAATSISPAGTYPIVPVPVDPGHRLGNYTVTANDGTLSVVSYTSRGASVPWSTYEAENMYINGGSILGPDYGVNTVASESSGRECVQLNATGQYVEFAAQGQANSIVVRYSVPDTASGAGANYTLSLYTNGVLAAELPVTSMYSWLYGSYPFANTPSEGSPRDFYDEVRFIGLSINPGDVIQLQKGAADAASYYDIDLVDLENVAAPLTQPANSLSIVSYGADPSGANDSSVALQNCINAAYSDSKSVWVPSGTYQVTNLINLPSNATIQGAGMWYSTFVGNAALYTNSARRVTFNGTGGSNIHLSDFAIVGKLNYRNDSEPNDGLGGSFGANSSITRIWVEHTKVGAWIVNSLGLLINGCRFRDTIADGCNIDIGMKNTTVTNCATRGTGDDCFAVWPTGYEPQSYTPGGNVFTFCTGELNFLANGGSLYGATNNVIQNCLFQDTTYGCGVLISTTFPITNDVSGQLITNSFGGNTVVQNCDILRCGGEDPGFGWRGAVQLCLQNYSITGINLLNLNIANSASEGLDIISPGSGVSLSSSFAANVNVSIYGLADSLPGIWAQSGTVGSMLVSNSIINGALVTSLSTPGIMDSGSPQFTFLFGAGYASSTINTSPAGLAFSVDGTNYNMSQTFNWLSGSSHILSAPATQTLAGTPYQWSSWTDGGALAHSVTANGSADTAVFGLAAPSLAITVSGANAVIAWSTNALGFNLQSTTNLTPPIIWNAISTTPSIVNGQNILTNSLSGTRMYFRLSQ